MVRVLVVCCENGWGGLKKAGDAEAGDFDGEGLIYVAREG